jgi:hypothetical protein
MVSLNLTIKQGKDSTKKIIELDAGQFERLAAVLGIFNPDFIKRLDKAERDIKAGRIRKINSLSDLKK